MAADDDDPQEFPDVSQKLAAPKKLSAFERERQAAEEKRRREEAENARALKEFESEFADDYEKYDGFPSSVNAPTGPRGFGYGGPQSRQGGYGGYGAYGSNAGYGGFGGNTGYGAAPRSGPGSLGPPPSMKRKRALEEAREAEEAARESEDFAAMSSDRRDGYTRPSERTEPTPAVSGPRPTVMLSGLPLDFDNNQAIRNLLKNHLEIHYINIRSPQAPDMARKSMAAIVELPAGTTNATIDSAVSSLRNKYLGDGYRLSISRHLTSTALQPDAPIIITSAEAPFGAQKVNKDQAGRTSLRNAPPPSEFAPPQSYGGPVQPADSFDSTVIVQPPSDMRTVRAIHTLVERLQSEPDPMRAMELEATLMASRKVRYDENFEFLYNARTPAGVYYRYLMWNDDVDLHCLQMSERGDQRSATQVLLDVSLAWVPPYGTAPFADLSSLGDALDHPAYTSSDEDDEDGEAGRINIEAMQGGGAAESAGIKYLTPYHVAKFAFLLTQMPTSNASLRKRDVAMISSFAISFAGVGAEDIVDKLVLNVHKPFTNTRCAKYLKEEDAHPEDEDDAYEPKDELPTIASAPVPDATTREKTTAEDTSGSKLVGLYLITDILHNSSTAGAKNAWKYRQLFEKAFKNCKTFRHLGQLEKELGWGRMKAENWKRKIGALFDIWEKSSIFAVDEFEGLKKDFFEVLTEEKEVAQPKEEKKLDMSRFKRVDGASSVVGSASPAPHAAWKNEKAPVVLKSELDGEPMDDDVDGVPMDDLDGEPMEDSDSTPAGDGPIEPSKPGISLKRKAPAPDAPKPRKHAEDMFADSDEE